MSKVTQKQLMFTLNSNLNNILIYLPNGVKASEVSGYTAQFEEPRYNLVETTDGENYTCADFRLFDGKDFIVPKAFTATKATLDRTFTPGIRSTVFLPFAFDATKFGKVYYFNGETMADETGIRFDPIPVAETVANAPFIIDPKVSKISAENVEVKETNESAKLIDNQMMGVYECGYVPENAYYLDTDGMLKRVTAENLQSINAGQAYFWISGEETDEIAVTYNKGVATGIVEVSGSDWRKSFETGDCYTLDGRKLNGRPSRKGIYIRNGRKFVVK